MDEAFETGGESGRTQTATPQRTGAEPTIEQMRESITKLEEANKALTAKRIESDRKEQERKLAEQERERLAADAEKKRQEAANDWEGRAKSVTAEKEKEAKAFQEQLNALKSAVHSLTVENALVMAAQFANAVNPAAVVKLFGDIAEPTDDLKNARIIPEKVKGYGVDPYRNSVEKSVKEVISEILAKDENAWMVKSSNTGGGAGTQANHQGGPTKWKSGEIKVIPTDPKQRAEMKASLEAQAQAQRR